MTTDPTIAASSRSGRDIKKKLAVLAGGILIAAIAVAVLLFVRHPQPPAILAAIRMGDAVSVETRYLDGWPDNRSGWHETYSTYSDFASAGATIAESLGAAGYSVGGPVASGQSVSIQAVRPDGTELFIDLQNVDSNLTVIQTGVTVTYYEP